MGMSKKQVKTQEELLKEALVPVEEQPYEVPGNWVWVKLGSIVEFKGGGTPSKDNELYWNGNIPWASVKDIKGLFLENTQDSITDAGLRDSSASIAEPGELLLITRMSPGKSTISKIRTAINQDLKIVKPKIDLSSFFLLMYFNINIKFIEHMSTGSTVKGIQINKLKEMSFPLPPLNEQKRIADKIEKLLDKINQVKQLIEEAKATFELRRAAILDKAFRGELTKKWREENGISIAEWQIVDLDQIASAIDPEPSHRTPSRYEGGVPYIGIKECDYDNEVIDFVGSRPVKPEVLEEHIQRYTINDGDFIIGKIGTVGKPFIIPTTRNYVLSANVILIQPMKDKVLSKYMFYLFNSPIIEDQLKAGINATTQAAFGIKKARKLTIPLCSIAEQAEIIRLLDMAFDKEKNAKELLGLKLEELTNSILSKAFKGELGTNLQVEENELFK